MHQSSVLKQQLNLYYANEKYPFETLMRMITMNHVEISPQFRDLGLESLNFPMWKLFLRPTVDELVSTMKRSRPLSLHLGVLLPIPLNGQSERQTNDDDDGYDSGAEERKTARPTVKPLSDSRFNCGGNFRLVQQRKELVLDLDITDVSQRFCPCAEMKRLCDICWLHMLGAYLILRHFLTQTFGYADKNLLWSYSGGKGLHCLVNSARALSLDDDQRKAIGRLIGQHCNDQSDANLCAYIRQLQRSDAAFVSLIQNTFFTRVIVQRNLLQSETFRQFCHDKIAWLMPAAAQLCPLGEWRDWRRLMALEEEQPQWWAAETRPTLWIAFRLFYPMIDDKPLAMKHLIKAPFSVHSQTKNIAMPMQGEQILEFLPSRDSISLECAVAGDSPEAEKRFANGKRVLDEWIDQYNSA